MKVLKIDEELTLKNLTYGFSSKIDARLKFYNSILQHQLTI